MSLDDKYKFTFVDDLIQKSNFKNGQCNTVDGLRVDFEDGWGLIRASNTTPCVIFRFEALLPDSRAVVDYRRECGCATGIGTARTLPATFHGASRGLSACGILSGVCANSAGMHGRCCGLNPQKPRRVVVRHRDVRGRDNLSDCRTANSSPRASRCQLGNRKYLAFRRSAPTN